jgi:ribosomal protein S15P/S13E
MQIIEHNKNKLVLYFRRSLVARLFVGISFILVGSFFCVISLLLTRHSEEAWILSSGMGIVHISGGIFWIINLPKVNTFTFDKARNCLIREQRALPKQPASQFMEIPLHLIIGVEVASPHSGADSPDSYYPNLILDSIYWRIRLDSDGRYDAAVKLAKLISQFLEVDYFPDESKAPLRVWDQKSLGGAAPYQFYWKYFEEEIDRLQQHLSQHPSDAEVHQELGILIRSNRKEATDHFKQAENLFEAQEDIDRAVLAKVLQDLVNWKS